VSLYSLEDALVPIRSEPSLACGRLSLNFGVAIEWSVIFCFEIVGRRSLRIRGGLRLKEVAGGKLAGTRMLFVFDCEIAINIGPLLTLRRDGRIGRSSNG
jgi:hypothetical protein